MGVSDEMMFAVNYTNYSKFFLVILRGVLCKNLYIFVT